MTTTAPQRRGRPRRDEERRVTGTPTTLQDLILAYKQASGTSWHDLARASGLNPTWWTGRATGSRPLKELPDRETIQAVAQATGLELRTVAAAAVLQVYPDGYYGALLSNGITHPESLLTSLMPVGTELLADEDAHAIAGQIGAAVRQAQRIAELEAQLAERPAVKAPARTRRT
jgi:hypothetical protein